MEQQINQSLMVAVDSSHQPSQNANVNSETSLGSISLYLEAFVHIDPTQAAAGNKISSKGQTNPLINSAA